MARLWLVTFGQHLIMSLHKITCYQVASPPVDLCRVSCIPPVFKCALFYKKWGDVLFLWGRYSNRAVQKWLTAPQESGNIQRGGYNLRVKWTRLHCVSNYSKLLNEQRGAIENATRVILQKMWVCRNSGHPALGWGMQKNKPQMR